MRPLSICDTEIAPHIRHILEDLAVKNFLQPFFLLEEGDCQFMVRGMIKNYMDFPHNLIMDQTKVSKFLLLIHGLKRNRCGKFSRSRNW